MNRNIFLSYATQNFASARDDLCASAVSVGFDDAYARSPADLDPTFQRNNSLLLSQKRGAGYWAWKPQIILQELQKLDASDVLVYSDAGRSKYNQIRVFPSRLINKVRHAGFLTGTLIPQHGPISRWTKRDALILLDMDRAEIYVQPTIQATWSMWTPTDSAFRFLDLWKSFCSDIRCVSDEENTLGHNNLPDFRDHRHDQAISTLLTYREGAPFLDYRDTSLFLILNLRVKSALANNFLKRIDDAELLERGQLATALWRAFWDLRQNKIIRMSASTQS
jgi:hypothetical protein